MPNGTPLSEEDARAIMAGGFADACREILSGACAAIFWFAQDDADRPILGNGSVTFLQTPERLLGVTAAHVIRGYQAVRDVRPVTLQIGDEIFEKLRTIAISDRLDIATFELTARTLAGNGKPIVPFASWPPVAPLEGFGIMVAGYPGGERRIEGRLEVNFGLFTGLGIARRVTVDQVTWLIEREYCMEGGPVPAMPPNYDLGGISGGPLVALWESAAGLVTYRLAAIVSEANAGLEHIVGKRAEYIQPDGSIDEPVGI
ncbi:MAG: hypothetical protein RIM84_00525 [Alphaproteobacteria bacterium]